MTNDNPTAEFSTGRGVESLPDGRQRPLTDRERARIERTAAIRDQSIETVETEHRQR